MDCATRMSTPSFIYVGTLGFLTPCNHAIHPLDQPPVLERHWQQMLEDLWEERRLGRLSGPFTSPHWWPVAAVGFENEELIPLPDGEIAISFCFSVKQSGKILREDFRRSGHNATVCVCVYDTPPHDDVDKFINVAKAYASVGTTSQMWSWSQDLSGAYRQFPVRNPTDYCAIITDHGPMLFRHHTLTFSVWSFNRCGGALFLFQCSGT